MTLEQEIHQITQIPIGALRGQSLANFGVEQRINWATTRTKKWKEDKVYCLLGVFEVFLPLIYGEGEANATRRLQEEIKKRQKGQGTESLREIGGVSLFHVEYVPLDWTLTALSPTVVALS